MWLLYHIFSWLWYTWCSLKFMSILTRASSLNQESKSLEFPAQAPPIKYICACSFPPLFLAKVLIQSTQTLRFSLLQSIYHTTILSKILFKLLPLTFNNYHIYFACIRKMSYAIYNENKLYESISIKTSAN